QDTRRVLTAREQLQLLGAVVDSLLKLGDEPLHDALVVRVVQLQPSEVTEYVTHGPNAVRFLDLEPPARHPESGGVALEAALLQDRHQPGGGGQRPQGCGMELAGAVLSPDVNRAQSPAGDAQGAEQSG